MSLALMHRPRKARQAVALRVTLKTVLHIRNGRCENFSCVHAFKTMSNASQNLSFASSIVMPNVLNSTCEKPCRLRSPSGRRKVIGKGILFRHHDKRIVKRKNGDRRAQAN